MLNPSETPSKGATLFAISEVAEMRYARTANGWVLYEMPADEASLAALDAPLPLLTA